MNTEKFEERNIIIKNMIQEHILSGKLPSQLDFDIIIDKIRERDRDESAVDFRIMETCRGMTIGVRLVLYIQKEIEALKLKEGPIDIPKSLTAENGSKALLPLEYGLDFCPISKRYTIKIVATAFDENGNPYLYAVRNGETALSAVDFYFYYERMPSNRNDNYIRDFRFTSIEDALKAYSVFKNRAK